MTETNLETHGLASYEIEMRKALSAIYENHQKKLTDFASKQINELMDSDPVTPEIFAAHAKGFCRQNFIDTDFIY